MIKYKSILKSKKWNKCPKRVVDASFSNWSISKCITSSAFSRVCFLYSLVWMLLNFTFKYEIWFWTEKKMNFSILKLSYFKLYILRLRLSFFFFFFLQHNYNDDKFLQNNCDNLLKQVCKITSENARKVILCNYLTSCSLGTTFLKRGELTV